jgi:hypothetical protein
VRCDDAALAADKPARPAAIRHRQCGGHGPLLRGDVKVRMRAVLNARSVDARRRARGTGIVIGADGLILTGI